MSSTKQNVVKVDGQWTVDGRPRETIQLLSHNHPANIPGKSLIACIITLPPNGATPPHTHSGATLSGCMIQGRTVNQMNCDGPFESSPGDSFYEQPGCHHIRSENLSKTEDAKISVVFVIDDEVVKDGYDLLRVLDVDKEQKEQ